MFRWISSKIFGGNQTETGTKEESFKDAVEILETENDNNLVNELLENVNNSAVVTDEKEDNRDVMSKPDDSATKTDTSVWENVEISQTEAPGDVQNTSTWENVEMTTLTSPTLVVNEMKIDSKENRSNNPNNNTSLWENIEIAKTPLSLGLDTKTEGESEINIDMLTSAIESDIKSESSDIKSQTDLMLTLSKRSINQEMKEFAAKSQNDQNKSRRNGNKKTDLGHGVISSGTPKNRKVQKDEADKDSQRTKVGIQKEKVETTETEKASKHSEEPEDILSLVIRLTAEGKLVRAKKLIYGLGHLKGIDNKEIDSHILKQYEIAVNKNSYGWIKDARYFAEVMYSRQWIDKNLPTLHQRKRNSDRDREQKRQEWREWRKKENEAPANEERQSRFTGMCQDVRLLSNPDLPVVRSNAAAKQPENTDADKANVNESNNSKDNTKSEDKEVVETKEKLQNFNQMKSAIEDIISRRAEKRPKMLKSEEGFGYQQRSQQQNVEEESSGLIVKAVTDDDQIIQSVDVCMPTSSSSERQEFMEIQSHDESTIKMTKDNSKEDIQIKDCVVKLERLPGYYHVQSPKLKSPDAINTSKSENKSSNLSGECKSPAGGVKTRGTPKRGLSDHSKKPWVNGDDVIAVEESAEDHNYVHWIGSDNGCKMTVSSDDLKVDDDCIISYGKSVNKPEVLSDPNSPDIQKFVKDILGKVCSDVNARSEQNGGSANVQNLIDTDSAIMDMSDQTGTVDHHLYQDQFVNFCQQASAAGDAGDNSTSNEVPSFQNEYLQFCQTKSD